MAKSSTRASRRCFSRSHQSGSWASGFAFVILCSARCRSRRLTSPVCREEDREGCRKVAAGLSGCEWFNARGSGELLRRALSRQSPFDTEVVRECVPAYPQFRPGRVAFHANKSQGELAILATLPVRERQSGFICVKC